MFKRVFSVFAFVVLSSLPALAADAVGFRELTLPDSGGARALDVALWYPSDDAQAPTLFGDNPAFVGVPVVRDAAMRPGRYPLVVLSHGYSGNWSNEAWLASVLVGQGYVVAAANHPGTTSRDMNPSDGARLWQRPRDISHVIDGIMADLALSGALDPERVAVIGHSLGGWTAMAVAGGRFDADIFEADCNAHAELAACVVYHRLGAGRDAESRAALGQDLKDWRVKAVVSLDLGLARGFDPESLAAIDLPVLVIAAGAPNPELPAALESRFLADHLPAARTRYVEIADAAHFSFLPVCKPGGVALLEEDVPGDGIICRDGGGRDRATIHSQVAELVMAFLAEALGQD